MSETARDILQRAHDELYAREQRLSKFAQELGDTKKAREAVAKQLRLLGGTLPPKQLTAGTSAPTSRRGRAEINVETGVPKQMIDAVSGSLDPLSADEIAKRIGREPAGWISAQLHRLVAQGALILVDGRYGVPQKLEDATIEPEANVPTV